MVKPEDKFCVVLATQRTGTLGFGSGVEVNFDIKWLGEIFLSDQADPDIDIHADAVFTHKRATSPKLNFFNFRYYMLRERPELSYPSPENQDLLFSKYLEFIDQRVGRNHYLIDIKYDSWHHLNVYWTMPPQRPHLVRMVLEKSLPVVHILRDNYFEIYCSLRLAIESGMWHRFDDQTRDATKLTIDVKNCKMRMDAISFNRSWFIDMFAGYGKYYEIKYEEIFDDDRLSKKCRELVRGVFDIEPTGDELLRARKTTPPLKDLVANRDEVLEFFGGTPYEAMVREALDA